MVIYPVNAVWPNVTTKRRRYLVDHGCTVIGFLPVENGRVKKEAEKCEGEEILPV